MKHRIKVWGDFACFTRPEAKTERVSYDVMTPSSARGICEAIFWNPQIQWNIESIQVLNPIKWINIRRNELLSRAINQKGIWIEQSRVQRFSLFLKDTAYIIQASLKPFSSDVNLERKFNTIFKRRASKGKCFFQPYLGCREFSCYFQLLEEDDRDQPISETRDLGWMLYNMKYGEEGITPQFFSATMKNGEMIVPSKGSAEIKG
jgi:CRISPR-associated protein Cas5d